MDPVHAIKHHQVDFSNFDNLAADVISKTIALSVFKKATRQQTGHIKISPETLVRALQHNLLFSYLIDHVDPTLLTKQLLTSALTHNVSAAIIKKILKRRPHIEISPEMLLQTNDTGSFLHLLEVISPPLLNEQILTKAVQLSVNIEDLEQLIFQRTPTTLVSKETILHSLKNKYTFSYLVQKSDPDILTGDILDACVKKHLSTYMLEKLFKKSVNIPISENTLLLSLQHKNITTYSNVFSYLLNKIDQSMITEELLIEALRCNISLATLHKMFTKNPFLQATQQALAAAKNNEKIHNFLKKKINPPL